MKRFNTYSEFLNEALDPSRFLTQEQIDCYRALFAIELDGYVTTLEGMGNIVEILPEQKWYWNSANGAFLSMIRKSTCDPNDGIDDHYISFNGYTALTQAIRITPP